MAQAIGRGLRPPRREEEPQPARLKFLVAEARHRGVQAARARGARRPCPTTRAGRTYLDRDPDATTRSRRAPGRAAQRRGRSPRASTSGRATNVYRAAAARLRGRRPSPCRSATARPTRSARSADIAAPLRRRRPCAPPSSRTSCCAGCREADLPALYTELQGDRPAPSPAPGTIVDVTACPGTDTCKLGIASSRGLAGELRTRLAAQAVDAGRGRPRPAHQDQRLLQLLRPAPRRRHRLLRQQPQRRRLHRAALPGRARRPVARERAARTAWRSARCRPSASPRSSTRITDRFVAERAGRASPSRTSASASARRSSRRWSTTCTTVPPHDERPRRSTATGATRASTRSATWASASAPARSSRSTDFELAAAESIAFEAQVALDDGDLARADERAYAAMLGGRPRAGAHREPERARTTPTRSCASSRSASTTRSGSSTASPRAASRARSSTATRSRPRRTRPRPRASWSRRRSSSSTPSTPFEIREAGAQSALV